ncbi:MAG TPA: hypothetical protein VK935_02435 [Actinomycetospora sp.]|nr:hypothetical protein [Actinomycetospora sp.]
MRFTGKDVIATALVAAVVVAYVVFVAVGQVWFVDTVREMAIVALIGGVLSRSIGGRTGFHPRWPAVVANFATLGLGILATITGSSVVLAVFVVATAALAVAALSVQAHSGKAGATAKERMS